MFPYGQKSPNSLKTGPSVGRLTNGNHFWITDVRYWIRLSDLINLPVRFGWLSPVWYDIRSQTNWSDDGCEHCSYSDYDVQQMLDLYWKIPSYHLSIKQWLNSRWAGWVTDAPPPPRKNSEPPKNFSKWIKNYSKNKKLLKKN